MTDSTGPESVESFRRRAREWITANLSPVPDEPDASAGEGGGGRDEAAWQRARKLQARLFEGGFAGIWVPTPPTTHSAWPAPTGTCPSTPG